MMKLLQRAAIAILTLITSQFADAQEQTNRYPLIPYPVSLQPASGQFVITAQTALVFDAAFTNEAEQLQMMAEHALGSRLQPTGSSTITIKLDKTITKPEGYHLTITPQKITLAAKEPAGVFRAIETIRQLLPASIEGQHAPLTSLAVPAVDIKDYPAYAWRGMHLDVSRHFFSIAYLKKFIDVMALYKMNKLHLHLTDDQGWRIEIKKYPLLTEQGAWRTFNNQDTICMKAAVDNPDMAIDTQHIIQRDGKTLYGGFYSQKDMKRLVKYALNKHIDIVPEIDMPGHMMAAINNYPFLSCTGGSQWGPLFTTPICPCKETTFEFAENVFSEIMDIFPSEYIHLGADEVEKSSWAQSDDCKQLMAHEGLKDVNELQSYFVKRMEKFFNSKGRKLIGWDEILEGGVSATANVMYWRSWVPTAPITAAKHGNHVIMTPGNPLYFDNPADVHSIDNIYHFAVVPKGLTEKEGKNIIGAQANIWSERIPSENRADFMYMPRMTALAERLWTNKNDYTAYLQRLSKQYPRLDALHVHYRLPDIMGLVEENVFTDKAALQVNSPIPGLIIHYTTDGSIPTVSSTILPTPLVITDNTSVKLAACTTTGLRGDIYTLHYTKEGYHAPVTITNTKPGLQCSYYKAFFKNTGELTTAKPDSAFIAHNFVVPASVNAPSFALRYTGYINVPATGIYSFYLTCDDGGVLTIADKVTVDNDGLHSAIQKSGQIALEKGKHPLKLDFIEGGGGFTLLLKYSVSNRALLDVPKEWLSY
jgi:hexosaminidase